MRTDRLFHRVVLALMFVALVVFLAGRIIPAFPFKMTTNVFCFLLLAANILLTWRNERFNQKRNMIICGILAIIMVFLAVVTF